MYRGLSPSSTYKISAGEYAPLTTPGQATYMNGTVQELITALRNVGVSRCRLEQDYIKHSVQLMINPEAPGRKAAEVLWRELPCGIQTVGDEWYEISDAMGQPHFVCLSRLPQTVPWPVGPEFQEDPEDPLTIQDAAHLLDHSVEMIESLLMDLGQGEPRLLPGRSPRSVLLASLYWYLHSFGCKTPLEYLAKRGWNVLPPEIINRLR